MVVVSAVAKPDGACVEASVARVSRSIKMGEVVIHPRREPGHEVLEKVCLSVPSCTDRARATHVHSNHTTVRVKGQIRRRQSLDVGFVALAAFLLFQINLLLLEGTEIVQLFLWYPVARVPFVSACIAKQL